MHATGVAARRDQSVEAGEIRLHHLVVTRQREDEGDVDRVATRGHRLDGAEARVGRGDLDKQVRPGDGLVKEGRLVDGRLRVVGEVGSISMDT